MKKSVLVVIVLTLSLICAGLAFADQAADAKANVEKAIAMVKEQGVDATLKAVADPKGPFVSGDLYIFAGALDKIIMVAHPFKPQLVNKDLRLFKDIKGKQFFNEFVEVAKTKGAGWVDYYWPKPGGSKPVAKASYVQRVPGENLYFGCGIYK